MTRGRIATVLVGLAACAALLAPRAGLAEALVVDAERLYPVSGPPIENGRVVVEKGRIARVGPASKVGVPRGARRLAAAVATPGLIDVQTTVGLSGLYNVPADQDQDETSDPNQAELRALDAFNPDEPLLRWQLAHGVVLVQSGPGPRTPVAGQAGIFRTHGDLADRMLVREPSALVMNLGESPKEAFGGKGKRPQTRMATAAILRAALLSGRQYARAVAKAKKGGGFLGLGGGEKPAPPERDLEREALAAAVTGELPVVFVAHRADDIATALRVAEEFELRRFAIAGATEGYLVADLLRAARVPVFVGPVMERAHSPQTLGATYENAALLARAGVPIAIRSGHEPYAPKSRAVLFEAAVAAANGLGFDAALRAITLGAAEALDVADHYGSLEKGKVADVVLYDGDPFEYVSHVTAVVAGGEVAYEREPR